MTDRNKCPATGKSMFKTLKEANQAIVTIKSYNCLNNKMFTNTKRTKKKSSVKRSYLCEKCYSYHITSRNAYEITHNKEDREVAEKYLNSIDIASWKANSIPFSEGHIPPPKQNK